jgi:hypothetical protein
MSTDLLDLDAAIESSFQTQKEPEDESLDGEYAGNEDKKGDAEDGKKIEGDEGGKTEGVDDQDKGEKKEGENEVEDPEKKKITPAEKPPKPDRVQKRIDELTREKYQLRRELDEVKKQIELKEPDLPPKPDPKDYTFEPKNPESLKEAQRKFDFDTGKWQAKVDGIKENLEQRDAKRIELERSEYQSRIKTEKVKYPDFESAVNSISHIPMTPELHDALHIEDDATDLLYFLGKHPAIAEDVLSLPSHRQSRKLAEISIKLKLAQERKKVVVSKAPSPPAKVSGGGGGKKDPSKMSAQEYYDTYVKNKKT